MKDKFILVGLLCWPLAFLLHLANDHDKDEATPTYQFEVLDHGDVYVLDHDLSKGDCRARLKAKPEGYCRAVRHGHPVR
ncbi:hypothetical protein KNJ79_05270 [Sphingopyxis indica]|uniref:hypothetical protein n=1 Tax=Sphingopyxis indica TaxID=436663 RepID=UPI00293951E2|nr:hypothetical protein [Sphingopyxis indica]WOF44343.1 hypothetical protein KNJ79_05270 [Sphingopyxis indica]